MIIGSAKSVLEKTISKDKRRKGSSWAVGVFTLINP